MLIWLSACVSQEAQPALATWYADRDGDLWGDGANATLSAARPGGYVERPGDCDDGDPLANPDGLEVCGGGDEDCDQRLDDDDPSLAAASATTWWSDLDGDGLGNPLQDHARCEGGPGWTDNELDCDDLAPLSLDWVNGRDDDCSDPVDRMATVQLPRWSGLPGMNVGSSLAVGAFDDAGGLSDIAALVSWQGGAAVVGWANPEGMVLEATFSLSTDAYTRVSGLPDLDGDGRDELVVTFWDSELQSYVLAQVDGALESDHELSDALLSATPCRQCVVGEVADWDGDGALEVPIAQPGSVGFYEGVPEGEQLDLVEADFVIATPGGLASPVHRAELDGDPLPELAVLLDLQGTLAVLMDPFDAGQSDLLDGLLLPMDLGLDLALGDLDGDGLDELAAPAALGGIGLWTGDPESWTREPDTLVQAGFGGELTTGQVELPDLDGDGDQDVMVTSLDVAFVFARDPLFSEFIGGSQADLFVYHDPHSLQLQLHTADLDADGYEDVLIGSSHSARLALLRGGPRISGL